MVCREQNRPASALAPFPETLMENKARIHSGEVYDPAKPRLPLAACFDGLPGIATSDTRLTRRVSPWKRHPCNKPLTETRPWPPETGRRQCAWHSHRCVLTQLLKGTKCGLFPALGCPVSTCEPCWLFDTEWKITS